MSVFSHQPVKQTVAEINHFNDFSICISVTWQNFRHWLSTRKKKHRIPQQAMMIPGTMKDIPQADETKTPAMREPRMFPTEVCEFHTPMMKPRLHGEKTNKQTERNSEDICVDASQQKLRQSCSKDCFWILLKGPIIWLDQRIAHFVSLVAYESCYTEVNTKSLLLWISSEWQDTRTMS